MNAVALVPFGSGHHIKITPMGIEAIARQLPFEEWEALMGQVRTMHGAIQWVLGDALNYGEDRYGEQYAQALDAVGWRPETVANYANICRAFPYARRRPKLAFSHHRAVYKLAEPACSKLLDAAEQYGLTERQLRDLTRTATGKPVHPAIVLGVQPASLDWAKKELTTGPWKTALVSWRVA